MDPICLNGLKERINQWDCKNIIDFLERINLPEVAKKISNIKSS